VIHNENHFTAIHRHLLNQPTIHKHEIALRIQNTINPNNNDAR
jgi:hypothetical protein